MECKKSIFITIGSLVLGSAIAWSISSSIAVAADTQYKISMTRSNPNEAISRDGILSAVKEKYTGRILSIQESPSPSTPDCHIVRMLSLTGEYMTIRVACGD